MTRQEWVEEMVTILSNPPYQFMKRNVEAYANGLADEYYAEGFDHQEALKDSGFTRMARFR